MSIYIYEMKFIKRKNQKTKKQKNKKKIINNNERKYKQEIYY